MAVLCANVKLVVAHAISSLNHAGRRHLSVHKCWETRHRKIWTARRRRRARLHRFTHAHSFSGCRWLSRGERGGGLWTAPMGTSVAPLRTAVVIRSADVPHRIASAVHGQYNCAGGDDGTVDHRRQACQIGAARCRGTALKRFTHTHGHHRVGRCCCRSRVYLGGRLR
jgi:hypothetical protein